MHDILDDIRMLVVVYHREARYADELDGESAILSSLFYRVPGVRE